MQKSLPHENHQDFLTSSFVGVFGITKLFYYSSFNVFNDMWWKNTCNLKSTNFLQCKTISCILFTACQKTEHQWNEVGNVIDVTYNWIISNLYFFEVFLIGFVIAC